MSRVSSSPYHGTAVDFGNGGVFIRGASGSGKSDLALRLLTAGGRLVGDDQIHLQARQGRLFAFPVDILRGMIEVRGVGLLKLSFADMTHVRLVIDLVAREEVPRLPDWAEIPLEGIMVPRLSLYAFDASTPEKIIRALAVADNPEMIVK